LARQQRDVRLQTPDARRKLSIGHEPFWHEVRRGLYLGYRKGLNGGVWWVREYRGGRYAKRRLGIADDEINADGATVLSWSDAIKQVFGEERPTLKTAAGSVTLNQALEDYFSHRSAKSPSGSVKTDRAKAKAFIPPKLGQQKISEITAQELLRWRDGMVSESTPASTTQKPITSHGLRVIRRTSRGKTPTGMSPPVWLTCCNCRDIYNRIPRALVRRRSRKAHRRHVRAPPLHRRRCGRTQILLPPDTG